MFGITCAPELFQKIMEKILIGCSGTINFIDDIIIFGENLDQHNVRLKQTLDTLKKYNVLLNEKKCAYNIKAVKFLGHVLSQEGIKPLDTHVWVFQNL